jgi:hypothetical protein
VSCRDARCTAAPSNGRNTDVFIYAAMVKLGVGAICNRHVRNARLPVGDAFVLAPPRRISTPEHVAMTLCCSRAHSRVHLEPLRYVTRRRAASERVKVENEITLEVLAQHSRLRHQCGPPCRRVRCRTPRLHHPGVGGLPTRVSGLGFLLRPGWQRQPTRVSLPAQSLQQLCSARFIQTWQRDTRNRVHARATATTINAPTTTTRATSSEGLAANVLPPRSLDNNARGTKLCVLAVLHARDPSGRVPLAVEVPLQPWVLETVTVATPRRLHASGCGVLALVEVLLHSMRWDHVPAKGESVGR